MFAISIDFSWCWYTLDCFRSVGAAAVPSLLHVIAEHNNLRACLGSLLLSSSLSLALSLHCNALRKGPSLVLCAATEVIKILAAPGASRNCCKKPPHNYLLIWYASMQDISLALIGFGSVSSVPRASWVPLFMKEHV